jgi:hypothetical protein
MLDAIPEDASLDGQIDLPANDTEDREGAEAGQEAEAPAEEVVEDEGAEAPVSAGDDELVETEWYGEKIKISKSGEQYLNKFFTEKSQKLSQDHQQRLAEVQRLKDDAERKMQEAQEWYEQLQATIDANPQLAENWKAAEKRADPMRRELEKMRSEFNSYKESQEVAAAEAQVQQELSMMAQRYKLDKDAALDQRSVERLALAEVVTSGYQVPLEHAYQRAVAQANQTAKAGRVRKLKEAAGNSAKVPAAPTSAGTRNGGKQAPAKKMSLDELLEFHLSKPAEFFER